MKEEAYKFISVQVEACEIRTQLANDAKVIAIDC